MTESGVTDDESGFCKALLSGCCSWEKDKNGDKKIMKM